MATTWRILVPPLWRRLLNSTAHARLLLDRHPRGPGLAQAVRDLQERRRVLLREVGKRGGAA
jgi:hypothetical protein